MSELCGVCKTPLNIPHSTIVVPIYKSEEHIESVFHFAENVGNATPGGVKLTFVIDGTPDRSVEQIHKFASKSSLDVTVVELARNFGVGPALHAGLTHVDSCAVVVFGSDLQEPEELFIEFFRRILCNEADVCLGQRLTRDDPPFMKLCANFYWWVNRHFLDNDSPRGGFDVFGLSRSARDALTNLPELNTNLTSQLQWIGFRRTYIPYRRRARLSGKSTWSMRRKIKLFADSIYGFSGAPIAALFIVGALALFIVVSLSVATLIGWMLGWIEIRGYTTLILLAAFGQAVNITALGILGGYLYRTFDNSKQRPRYILRSIEYLDKKEQKMAASMVEKHE